MTRMSEEPVGDGVDVDKVDSGRFCEKEGSYKVGAFQSDKAQAEEDWVTWGDQMRSKG